MSDRRADQGAPLFPRRTLSGPSESPEPEGREADHDAGPPTAAVSRVDVDREEQPTRREPPPQVPPPVGRPLHPGQQSAQQQRGAAAERTRQQRTAAAPTGRQRHRPPRKARLRVVRLDPWSVMKMAFALSIALAIVTVIAVAIVWSVLDAAGVWEAINTSVDTLTNPRAGDEAFDVEEFVGLGRVMGLTAVVAVANIVLLTALATLGAFLYNLAAALLGGFEITLAEDR